MTARYYYWVQAASTVKVLLYEPIPDINPYISHYTRATQHNENENVNIYSQNVNLTVLN